MLVQKGLRSLTTTKIAPIHPGEVLMDDFIEGFGITQHKLAVAIGVPGGVWVFRTVCFERVVLSSPGCLWPGRMDDHEEVLEAHA